MLFALSIPAYSQLPEFELELTKTDENCLGNGSITFTVTDTSPLASVVFTVYKYPNITTPVSVLETTSLESLSAGNYKVVATQTLLDVFNSEQQDITINNTIIPLVYEISATNQSCPQGGNITITTTSGTAASYEIISGPVVRTSQTSGTFEGLPEGTYNIRVFDECGEGVVTTYTLLLNNVSLSISEATHPDGLGECESIIANNTITPSSGSSISYPVTVKYIIHPPNDEPDIIVIQDFSSGDPDSLQISQVFPLYAGQEYTYDIEVIDNCGTVYPANNRVMDPKPVVATEVTPLPCGEHYLTINVSSFAAPLTISFLNAPEDFDPVAFNAGHPGTFNEGTIVYGGEENAMPEGLYEIEVTDGCGRKETTTVEIADVIPTPAAGAINNGCFSEFGRITISVPDRDIVSAIIVSAPATYTQPLPHNVTAAIVAGRVVLDNMPLGLYQLTIIDECGQEYLVTVEVPPFEQQGFTAVGRADCASGSGGIKINSGNGKLASIIMTSAPPGINHSLPYDVSFNIAPTTGILFMSGLPEGDYVFNATDVCGVSGIVTVTVTGYQPSQNPYTFVPHCGSFDLILADNNMSQSATYWLQRQNDATGEWGHPDTGVPYTDGSLPNESNSENLQNNTTTHNLTYTGTLRILKAFPSVSSGVGETNCFDDFDPFDFRIGLEIANAYTMDCLAAPNDIYIEAYGMAPYTYEIIEKDGQPFLLDNGNSNIFSGLEPAIYKFRVEDACGERAQSIFNVNLLPSLVEAYNPGDILFCTEGETALNHEFNLAAQDAGVLGDQSPGRYTVTYHLSAEDADNGVNALPDIYNNISSPQTIYARVIHNAIDLCYATVPFQLRVNQSPEPDIPEEVFLCNEDTVMLDAGNGYDEYLWSTGETTQSIVVDEIGEYTVTVRNYYDDEFCETSDVFLVSASAEATNVIIETGDWTDDRNSIVVNATGTGDYEYSLDGEVYQPDNVFSGLATGIYTVFIRDKNGCGLVDKEVVLLNYPKFFTPNGDGVNDKWRIQYSTKEPEMFLLIYDRYGKLITTFNGMSEGWDGTMNGLKLPSTDYWFVAHRQDGKVFKGHFAMKR